MQNRNDMFELKAALDAEQDFLASIHPKASGLWCCKQCGAAINNGYSWNGLCVVCSEPYLNPEFEG